MLGNHEIMNLQAFGLATNAYVRYQHFEGFCDDASESGRATTPTVGCSPRTANNRTPPFIAEQRQLHSSKFNMYSDRLYINILYITVAISAHQYNRS